MCVDCLSETQGSIVEMALLEGVLWGPTGAEHQLSAIWNIESFLEKLLALVLGSQSELRGSRQTTEATRNR